jgi:hypothetical protein
MITAPTPWQADVLTAPENVNLALFGSRGRGATTAAELLIARAMEKYPGSKHLFARNHLKSLSDVEDEFASLMTGIYGSRGLRINRSDHVISLPNESKLSFSPLADNNDLLKLQGVSFDTETFDEYGNYSGAQSRFVDNLRANLRGNNACPKRQTLLANPAGPNHVQCVRRFINKLPANAITTVGHADWLYMPATFRQNAHLPKGYADDLTESAHGDEALLKAWLDGDWHIARGAILGDVIDETKQMLPADGGDFPWKDRQAYEFLACDWGTASPSVCYLASRTLAPLGRFPRGSLILLDEVSSASREDLSVGLGWSPGRLADDINAMCDRWNVRNRHGVIDDARGLSPDETLIKTMERYNLHFLKPTKGRAENVALMRELLFNSQQGNQRPGMWISARCQDWWETVPLLPRDPNRPEVPNSAANDHAYDASSYAVSHVPRIVRYGFTNGY